MTQSSSLRVALIQIPGQTSLKQSYEIIEKKIEEATQQGAKLILLPELHNHLYFPQTEKVEHFDLAEKIPGPTTEFFSELAKKNKCVIVASVFEKRAPGIYHNTAVVLEQDGEIAGLYRKMHIPDDPGFYEKFYFTPGDLGFIPIETSVGCLGVLVCWDQWFPEAARLMALRGAEILIYPTAIGWDPQDEHAEQARQLDAWITVQRGHAIANGLPVAACNRVGLEIGVCQEHASEIQFWGHSFVVGPQGEWLAKANEKPELLICDIALNRTEQVRRIWPFLRDRRIDAYENLTKRFL